MNSNSPQVLVKHRWFWGWNDDKEENWLRQMALQGWHLRNISPFGRYTFEKGESIDVVYRLDYVQVTKKDEDYFQIFQDAGWDHVGEMMGWQYWRKEAEGGTLPEIFTDVESKLLKYQRLLGWLVIFLPILIISVTRLDVVERYESPFVVGLFVFLYGLLLFYVYAILRIFLRILKLRKE